MILKRLKLFTGEGASGIPLQSAVNKSQADFNKATNFSNVKLDGSAIANAANTGNTAAASANAPVDPKPGANVAPVANTANNAGGGAKSVSVMGGTKAAVPLKDANARVTFDPNNVKLDKDAFINNQIGGLKQQNSQLQSQLDAANKAKVESAARGRVAGRKHVGVWQGLKNTWNKAGTMKKIGMGGAALAGTYFLGKGLLGGNNNNDQ